MAAGRGERCENRTMMIQYTKKHRLIPTSFNDRRGIFMERSLDSVGVAWPVRSIPADTLAAASKLRLVECIRWWVSALKGTVGKVTREVARGSVSGFSLLLSVTPSCTMKMHLFQRRCKLAGKLKRSVMW